MSRLLKRWEEEVEHHVRVEARPGVEGGDDEVAVTHAVLIVGQRNAQEHPLDEEDGRVRDAKAREELHDRRADSEGAKGGEERRCGEGAVVVAAVVAAATTAMCCAAPTRRRRGREVAVLVGRIQNVLQ